MSDADKIKRFLEDRSVSGSLQKGFPFVTISRQAGAGGSTLAGQIVKELEQRPTVQGAAGWEVFDQKLCELLKEDESVKDSYDQLLAEEYHSEMKQFVGDLIAGQPRQYSLFKKIFELVRLLTTTGRVVVVGRAGAFVSKDLPHAVHIRLVAPEHYRAAWMAKMLQVDREEALRTIRNQDDSRARMVKDFFSADVNDPVHYHAVFNTQRMSIPAIAGIVADLIEEKIREMKPHR